MLLLKDKMGLKMKYFNMKDFLGFTEKSEFQGGSQKNNI